MACKFLAGFECLAARDSEGEFSGGAMVFVIVGKWVAKWLAHFSRIISRESIMEK
jgi:hypothetical protein